MSKIRIIEASVTEAGFRGVYYSGGCYSVIVPAAGIKVSWWPVPANGCRPGTRGHRLYHHYHYNDARKSHQEFHPIYRKNALTSNYEATRVRPVIYIVSQVVIKVTKWSAGGAVRRSNDNGREDKDEEGGTGGAAGWHLLTPAPLHTWPPVHLSPPASLVLCIPAPLHA